jgi:hypothetical protein
MKYLARDVIFGQMAKHTKDSGKRTKCTVSVSFHGKTERSTKDTLSMTNEKVRANLHGKMAAFTTECGETASNTVVANLSPRITWSALENGRMERKLDGSLDLSTNLCYISILKLTLMHIHSVLLH